MCGGADAEIGLCPDPLLDPDNAGVRSTMAIGRQFFCIPS